LPPASPSRLDSHLLAHLSLDVGQKPLHQEEIELSAAEKLTDLDLPLLFLAGDSPVASRAQFHCHYIRPHLFDLAHYLLHAFSETWAVPTMMISWDWLPGCSAGCINWTAGVASSLLFSVVFSKLITS